MANAAQPSLAGGPELRDEDALRAAVNAFEHMGGHVCVGPEHENLVRKTDRGFEVEAQGLPNLIHELVHALTLGHLDDDHGFPYGEIPLDMSRADHRAQLYEELCCCTLSCAFVAPAQRAAWFAEQIEILPVFYGLHDETRRWRRLVEATLQTHPHDWESFADACSARVQHALAEAAIRLKIPARDLLPSDLAAQGALARAFREGWTATETPSKIAGS